MNMVLEFWSNRILTALFNGVYQGLLLTMVVMILLKLVPRMNAATRHAVGFVALLVVAVLPLLHFFVPSSVRMGWMAPGPADRLRPAPAGEKEQASTIPGILTTPPLPSTLDGMLREGFSSGSPDLALNRVEAEIVTDSMLAPRLENSPAALASSFTEDTQETEFRPAQDQFSSATESPRPAPPVTMSLARFLSMIPPDQQLILPLWLGLLGVGLWLILACTRLGGLAHQIRLLNTLVRQAFPGPEKGQELCQRLSQEMGLTRKPRFMVCSAISAPIVVGFRHPCVLLPTHIGADLSPTQIEPILRHELAHIQRHDDWVNLIQQTIKALLFFHPAVCWLSRRLIIEREIACDDHVLAALKNARSYALFLTEFSSRAQGRRWIAAPAGWMNKSQLKERITMILNSQRNASPRLACGSAGVLTLTAALMAALGLLIGPRLAFGQDTVEAKSGNDSISSEMTATTETAVASSQPQAATIDVSVDVQPPTVEIEAPEGMVLSGPATVSADSVISGPRPKPELAPVMPAPPQPAAAPTAHRVIIGPGGKVAFGPDGITMSAPVLAQATAPRPVPAPLPSAPRARRESRETFKDDMERRLERLERMVEKLLTQDQKKPKKDVADDFVFGKKGQEFDLKDQDFKLEGKDFKLDKLPKFEWNQEDLARITQEAKRAAEQAVQESKRAVQQAQQEAQRAMQEAERAAREAQRMARQQFNRNVDIHADPTEHQAHAERSETLEARRKDLERQMKTLEQQLRQIQQQHERLAEEKEKMAKDQAHQDEEMKRSKMPSNAPEEDESSAGEKKVRKF